MAGKKKNLWCILCNSYVDDSLRLGKFHSRGGISVHTYCLYLSSNLSQTRNDKCGIFGFLIPDIHREAIRARHLHCFYCRKRNASIGCSISKCPRSFHLACGIRAGAVCQFVGQFKSFCHSHLPFEPNGPQKEERCAICLEALLSEHENTRLVNIIQSPCCSNGWYHKTCLQHYANTSGYFFKCPLCNNSDRFREVTLFGIFVPNCDAAWELEPGAFNELLQREAVCTAALCQNPNGREATDDELVYCQCCGSKPQHDGCRDSNEDYACDVCESIKKKTVNTKIQEEIQLVSNQSTQSYAENSSDDEIDPLDEPIGSFSVSRRRNTSQRLRSLDEEEKYDNDDDYDDYDPLNVHDWSYLTKTTFSVQNNDESACIGQIQQHVANHIKQKTTNHSLANISCIANPIRRHHYENHGAHRPASSSETGDDVDDQNVATNDNALKCKNTQSSTTAARVSNASCVGIGVRRRRLLSVSNDSNTESDDEPNINCNRTCKRSRVLSSTDEGELSGSISAATTSSTKSLSVISMRSLSIPSLSSWQSKSISSASMSSVASTRTTSLSPATSTSMTRSSSPASSMLAFEERTSNRTSDIRVRKNLSRRNDYLTAINEESNSTSESEESSTTSRSYAGKDGIREIMISSTKSCLSMQSSSGIARNIGDRKQLQLIDSSCSDNEDLDMVDQSSDTSNCTQRKTNAKNRQIKNNKQYKSNVQLSHEVSCIASRVRKRRSMTQECQDNSDDGGKHVHVQSVHNNNNNYSNRIKENVLQDISCIANRVRQRRSSRLKCSSR